MKKGNTLVSTLYSICNISFYLLIILFAFTLTFEVLGKNIKIDAKTTFKEWADEYTPERYSKTI